MRQQLRPLFDQVVIKELEPDRVRQSGLLLPPGEHQTPPQHGIVLAVGPGLDWWGSVGVKMPVVPGDHVVFPASAGVWIEVERSARVTVRGLGEDGEPVEIEAEMPEARVLQHELDHLDGVLTLDRTTKHQRREALRELRRR